MSPLASLTAFAFSALLSVPVLAQKMDNNDAAALKQLAQANLNEVEAGKLGAGKAQSPAVKQFGQKMVDDHGKMYEELKDAQALAAKAKDAEFKAAVQKAVPVIQQHLQMAQQISKSAAAGSSSGK